ncbi:hypothetical protein QR98_0102020, partial [Sarcoptes scabiei]
MELGSNLIDEQSSADDNLESVLRNQMISQLINGEDYDEKFKRNSDIPPGFIGVRGRRIQPSHLQSHQQFISAPLKKKEEEEEKKTLQSIGAIKNETETPGALYIDEWRRFNFFQKDLLNNTNDMLTDLIKSCQISCSSSGNGFIVLGDSTGSISLVSRNHSVVSFTAYQIA